MFHRSCRSRLRRTSAVRRMSGVRRMSAVRRALAVAMALLPALQPLAPALAGPNEQAERLFGRITGSVPSPSVLTQMASDISANNAIGAAQLAMQDPGFYNVTLRNFAAPARDRQQEIFPARIPFPASTRHNSEWTLAQPRYARAANMARRKALTGERKGIVFSLGFGSPPFCSLQYL